MADSNRLVTEELDGGGAKEENSGKPDLNSMQDFSVCGTLSPQIFLTKATICF